MFVAAPFGLAMRSCRHSFPDDPFEPLACGQSLFSSCWSYSRRRCHSLSGLPAYSDASKAYDFAILNKSSGNPYVRDGDVLIGSGAPQAGGTLPQSAISSHLRPRRNPMMTPSPTALRRAAIGWSDAKLLTSSTACP